jgi:hypothetical protein
LVTFIACEIVTGGLLTEILGSLPAGFPAANVNRRDGGGIADVALRHYSMTHALFACRPFPTNMARPTSQKAERHGHRKVHQRI